MTTAAAPLAILLVDDDEDDYLLTTDYLRDIRGQQFEVTWASTYEEGLVYLSERHFDLCFFDYLLGARTGLDLLRIAQDLRVRTPIILLTGKDDTKLDAQALRMGVADYLVKGEMDAEKLERSIRYALERTVALRALRDSEEKYRGVFEVSMDIICLLDATGRLTDTNEAATLLLGFEKGDFLQKRITDLFVKEVDKVVFFNKMEQRSNVREFEVEMLTAQGKILTCIAACTCLPLPGRPGEIFFLAIFHDITRRKKAEKNLQIAEKLATNGRFVRMLGHEIRNPLTNIDLSASQLRAEGIAPKLADYLDIIERNSKRIGDLLTDLLQLSNPGELESQPCSPHELLDTALGMAADRIALKKISVYRNYNTPSVLIQADPQKLKIALLNIIINAVEIVEPDSGVLHLSTEPEGDDLVALNIRDNGPGIEPEHLQHIFEPYFSQKNNGLGLGLASTLNIVQMHGGRVEVTTAPHEGATFRVLLPVG
jgi:PAS domain S-box-containing protein